MKALFCFVLLLLPFSAAFSQVFVKENRLWSNLEYGNQQPEKQAYHSYWIKFEGDTIINDTIYKNVWRSDDSLHTNWHAYGFIREDSSKKVFTRQVPGLNYTSSELLLYNFDLIPGDILYTNSGITIRIDSLSTIAFSGKQLKVIYTNIGLEWIEDIGSLSGVFNGQSNILLFQQYKSLLCFSENDTLIYHNENYSTCFVRHIPRAIPHLLTIREVYDFEVGDEFHYKLTSNGQSTPNAERITITAKEYSVDSSSLTYTYIHDNYFTTVSNQHLDYHFSQYTSQQELIALNLTMLSVTTVDSAIRSLTIYYDSLCHEPVNGFYIMDKRDFEPSSDYYEYGKGLGLVIYEYGGEGPSENTMFYYKKQGITCGTPDLTTSTDKFDEPENLKVYPNPASEFLTIEMGVPLPFDLVICDLSGKIVYSQNNSESRMIINVSGIHKGIYLLKIQSGNQIFHRKIVIL